MSWVATSYVKKLRVAPNGEPITKGEKLVLFVLSDYYHDELRYAWASLSHLAQESLHTRQGVILTLQSLEKKGVLSIMRSADAATKRVTNRYQFPELKAGSPAPPRPIPTTELVKPVDQTSQATSLGLVKPVDHIFPSYLSNDLSKDSCGGTTPATVGTLISHVKRRAESKSAATYQAYAAAHKSRYSVDPVRNAKTNTLLCQLVDRLGAEEAPLVAGFYLTLDTAPYAQAGHPLALLVRDCETLRTQWKRGPQPSPTVGPKAMQPAPRIEAQGEPCPPEVAAKLSRLLGRSTLSWPAECEAAV